MGATRLLTIGIVASLISAAILVGATGRAVVELSPATRLAVLGQMGGVVLLAFLLRRELRRAALAAVGTDREVRAVWPAASGMIAAGASLSICGDIINARVVDLTGIVAAQTLLSIPLFAVAHALYIAAFWRISADGMRGRPALGAATLAGWPIAALACWLVLVGDTPDPVVRWASLPYTFFVVGMGAISLRVAAVYGRRGLPTAIGGWLFVVSDGMIGAFLPGQPPRPWGMVIWGTYLIAQLLIVRTIALGRENPPRP